MWRFWDNEETFYICIRMSQSITQHMKLKLKFFPNPQAPNLIWQQMTKVQILIFFDNEHSIQGRRTTYDFHIYRIFFHFTLNFQKGNPNISISIFFTGPKAVGITLSLFMPALTALMWYNDVTNQSKRVSDTWLLDTWWMWRDHVVWRIMTRSRQSTKILLTHQHMDHSQNCHNFCNT